ncbi:hypothetical protein VA596_04360 [Amycolatopsis sp., V23-08]|uniref:Uncharacterized protein n=1 Tax=Amycolatopsis heterodermiae TaxID=3110235 RepID=A0ABU5QY01_9PSEU|nr:hypothetical protein [Amycolatopsis sp., V23-08]MEA5358758.1 hypothetical protein [Amycolatopsis sp., V23-08]
MGIVFGLLVFGLSLKLLTLILQSILPAALWQMVSGGWDLLLSLLNPGLVGIGAALILGGLVWVFIGRRH